MVWKHQATLSLTKRTVALGVNNIVPNFVAGVAWNYTVRSCQEEELEELYNGRMGVFTAKDRHTWGRAVMLNDIDGGQKAWLQVGRGVTICGRKMRQTHLPHVYVEWNNLDRQKDAAKRHEAPVEKRELESIRLDWSYLEGQADNLLRRSLNEARIGGCWVKGTLAELRLLQEARGESSYGITHWFGPGHVVIGSGAVVFIAKCGMVVVETRINARCTQEIPVTFRGEEMFVDTFTLVLQSKATLVSCQEGTPHRWNEDGRWICGYPDIAPCAKPDLLLVLRCQSLPISFLQAVRSENVSYIVTRAYKRPAKTACLSQSATLHSTGNISAEGSEHKPATTVQWNSKLFVIFPAESTAAQSTYSTFLCDLKL